MWLAAERGLALFAAALAWPLAAQNADAPRAPRILDSPLRAPTSVPTAAPGEPADAVPLIPVVRRPPNAARHAPVPEQRNHEPEEIVVIGQGGGRPQHGSEGRERQKEAASRGRVTATRLPQ
jgi:hypothetical protein